MKPLNYMIGDATNPVGDGQKVIAHICNDLGKWGRGFVTALSKKWKNPEHMYRAWWHNSKNQESYKEFKLGNIQFVKVDHDIHVVNMIAQKGINKKNDIKDRIDYKALMECLIRIKGTIILSEGFTVHMPKIGSGLAGGDWNKIEEMIEDILCADDIEVFVYQLEK